MGKNLVVIFDFNGTIAVSWGFNSEEILKKQNPNYLVKRPEELIALLDDF